MNKKNQDQIFVTQPSLPELNELIPYLQEIWESKIISIMDLFI